MSYAYNIYNFEGVKMIGIFDSGIGGVTILKENFDYHYLYYSDSKNNPYGDKNQKKKDFLRC